MEENGNGWNAAALWAQRTNWHVTEGKWLLHILSQVITKLEVGKRKQAEWEKWKQFSGWTERSDWEHLVDGRYVDQISL